MFGDGPLGDEIRARVQKVSNLHLAGWSTDPSLIYSSFDVLVLTSDNEAAAVVLIEAAMSGIPAVAMNVGSVSEVIVHEQTGLLVDSEAELVVTLRRLLGDQDLRQRLGRQAQKYAHEHFTTKRLVRSHEDLYQRLLAR
jgi:glycosyltransferase involved in cell wall biosynthesis